MKKQGNKKKFKVLLSIVLSLLLCFSVVGCSGGGTTVDETKTQLYVCYLNAGFGDRWLNAAKTRFEEMYKDYSFEKGKKGVEIIPDGVSSGSVQDLMETKRSHVYFIEGLNMQTLLTKNSMHDLTNASTVSLGESYGTDLEGKALPSYSGETKSIIEKMTDSEKVNYIINEHVYALPYIDGFNGMITYNADIFESKYLYYNADNTIGARKADGNLGLGPDGIANTADDGLPRTYDEFFALVNRMKWLGVVPFNWAGDYTRYVTELARSMVASNMGEEQFLQCLKGEGTLADYIESINSSGVYSTGVKDFSSSAGNQKDFLNTASVYNAIDFIYKIVKSEGYIASNAINSSYKHSYAQGDFYQGSEMINYDYAFLIDGSWWYNEAEAYIKSYENTTDKSRNDRNLYYMPMPKVNEAEFERLKGTNVVYTNYSSGITVKKGLSDKIALLAETFVRFYSTDASLAEYNTIVSVPRGLQYNLSSNQYSELSPYAKSLYSAKMSDVENGYGTYKVVSGVSRDNFYLNNSSIFSEVMQSQEGTDLIQQFIKKQSLNSYTWFNGILKLRGLK